MSSNNILCNECAQRHLPAGTRQIYPRMGFEAAEYQRLTIGAARQPRPDQRYMRVNGQQIDLDPGYYECDTCSARIFPGQPCGAWTIWIEGQSEPELWEGEYLENRP